MRVCNFVIVAMLTGMFCMYVFADETVSASAEGTTVDSDALDSYSTDLTYEQLVSDLAAYDGRKFKIKGKIIEVGGSCPAINQDAPKRWFRLCMNNDTHNILFVSFNEDLIDYRLYDDDRMMVYGMLDGTYDYESPSGAVRTLPWIRADFLERTGTHEQIVRGGREVELFCWKNGVFQGEYVPDDQ